MLKESSFQREFEEEEVHKSCLGLGKRGEEKYVRKAVGEENMKRKRLII